MFKGMLRRAMEAVHEFEETKRIRAYRELDKQLKTDESYEDYISALDRATKDIRERAAVAAKKRYEQGKDVTPTIHEQMTAIGLAMDLHAERQRKDDLANRDIHEMAKRQKMIQDVGDIAQKQLSKLAKDFRYNTPKEAPKASEEDVHKAIQNNDIYRNVQHRLLGVQHKQVAYGLDKYPEPLNQDTWSQIETIDHILDETIDQAHYLMMLKIKLEEQLESELELMNQAYSDAGCCVDTTRDMQGADLDGDIHRVVEETTVK